MGGGERVRERRPLLLLWFPRAWRAGPSMWRGGERESVGDLQSENGPRLWRAGLINWTPRHTHKNKHKNMHQSAMTGFSPNLKYFSSACCPETINPYWIQSLSASLYRESLKLLNHQSEANSGTLDFFNSEVVALALKWLAPCGLAVWRLQRREAGLIKKNSVHNVVSSAMSRHFVSLSRRCAV